MIVGIVQTVRGSTSMLLAVMAGHFFNDFYMTMIPPLLPLLSTQLGMSLAAAGLAVTAYSLLSSFSQPLFGLLSDYLGRGWFLTLALCWIAVLMTSVGYVSGYPAFVLICCMASLGSSVYHPLGAVVVSSMVKNPVTAIALFVGIGTLGVALAPIVAVPLAVTYGTRSLVLLAVPAILIALWYSTAGGNRLDLHTKLDSGTDQRGPQIPLPALVWLIILNLVLGFRLWQSRAFGTFLIVYFIATGLSPVQASVVLSMFLAAGTAGGLVGGFLGDRVTRHALITWSGVSSLVLFGTFFLVDGWLAWIVVSGAAFCLQMAQPVMVVMAREIVPTAAGFASGMMLGFSFGVAAFGPGFTGIMADTIGLDSALAFNLVLLAAATVVTLLLPAITTKLVGNEARMRLISGQV